MRRSDFHFDLPQHLIAQVPLADRSTSRMLVLDGADGRVEHGRFAELPGRLRAGDLLVINDTRVIPARLLGVKDSGGRVEVLVERVLEEGRVLAQVRASKSPKPGAILTLGADRGAPVAVETLGRRSDLFELRFPPEVSVEAVLEASGHVPLPPYIERADTDEDRSRYQTVYARAPGSVAAPTAGLHFTPEVLEALALAGVERAAVTLHVGAGTFQPVRTDDLSAHRMHSERLQVPAETSRAIAACRARGGRVVAVGTTVVRTLEAAPEAEPGVPGPWSGETDIFIRPGHCFRCVDGMITNFHLPESTLLMLVCAFAGRETTLAAYREAVARGYRFFSYGDAMLVWPDAAARAGEPE